MKIGEICNLINGKAFKPSDWSKTGIPIIRIQNLNDTTKPFNYFNREVEPKYHIKNGDVLLSWSGTPGTSFGAHIWQGGDAVLNQHIFRVEISEDRLLKKIFVNAVNLRLNDLIRNAHGGVGLSHITKGRLEKIEIPLPPLPTQHKIVEILEEADNLRKLRREADDKMKDLITSLFVQMFGDPSTNPKKWEIKKLEEVCVKITDGSHRTPKLIDKGYPFLTVTDLQDGSFDFLNVKCISEDDYKNLIKNDCKPLKGDVLFSKDGTIGKVVEIKEEKDFVILSSLAILRPQPKIVHPTYLSKIALTDFFINQAKEKQSGSALRRIILRSLKTVKIPLPPLPLQQEFAKLVNDIEDEKARQAESRKKLDELFNSLMQRAFIGELMA